MYIPKIGLTHIFREALQNFQGERLSKIYCICRKERHIFCLCEKPALKLHQMTIPPDLLAMEVVKKPLFLSGTT